MLMILSFAEVFFNSGVCPAEWRPFAKVAMRKLDMLDAAVRLDNLRSPPGNHLEALKRDRRGQWSIRIKQTMARVLPMDRPRSR
jgi:proteic killer suppression protein